MVDGSGSANVLLGADQAKLSYREDGHFCHHALSRRMGPSVKMIDRTYGHLSGPFSLKLRSAAPAFPAPTR